MHKCFLLCLGFVALFFASCSDDSSQGAEPVELSSSSASKTGYATVVDSAGDLAKCGKSNVGEIAVVLSTNELFVCTSSKWVSTTPSSSSVKFSSSSVDSPSSLKESSSSVELSSSASKASYATVVDSASSLAKCGKSNIGEIAVVLSTNELFVCTSSKWVSMTPSSSSVVVVSSSSVSSSSAKSSSSSPKPSDYLNVEKEYGEFVDARDKKKYKSIKIGKKVWMVENLNYDYGGGSFCGRDSCTLYGHYYTWGAAMDSAGVFSEAGVGCSYDNVCTPIEPVRGICPEGWHLPSKEEWQDLLDTVEGDGLALQATGFGSRWPNATNESGFTALPSGDGFMNYSYAYLWSSTQYSFEAAYHMLFNENGALLSMNLTSRSRLSVRCVKD